MSLLVLARIGVRVTRPGRRRICGSIVFGQNALMPMVQGLEGRPLWGRAVYTALHGARLSSVPSGDQSANPASVPGRSCAFHTLSRDLQVWRRGHLVPLAFRRSSMFPEGNVPGYVCNPGSPRERDAASQGHTSGIPTRAILHSWKLAPAAHHVLLSILVMTSPHLTSGRQF